MNLTGDESGATEGVPDDTADESQGGEREEMLAAYQATMREFLEAQGRIVTAFLEGAPAEGLEEAAAPPDQTAPSRPVPKLRRITSRREAPVSTSSAQGARSDESTARTAPAASSAGVRAEAPAPRPRETSRQPAISIQQLVLGVVEERTGYPQDMLGLDLALEADLGIDSIKRVEIVAALLKSLPADALTTRPDAAEALGGQRTLRAMIAWLEALAPRGQAISSRADAAPAARETAGDSAPRFVIRARHESIENVTPDNLSPGLALVTGDAGMELAAAMGLELERRGMKVVQLSTDTLADHARLRAACSAARATHGPVRVLVHLLPVSAGWLDPATTSLALWCKQAELNEKSLALLLQLAGEDLRSGGRVLAASALGGKFGRDDGARTGLSAQGGAVGLLKSLREEWHEVRVKAVDLDPKLAAQANAAHLLTELCLPGGRIEVGYPDGRRTVFRTELAESFAPAHAKRQPDSDWVVLAIGGSRGITAEVLYELAPSGLRLVIVGRSAEPGSEAADVAALEPARLRDHVIRKARGEGRTLRPVDAQREVSALMQAREIRANLAGLRAAGATVEYRSCDTRDERQVAALLEQLYAKHGRLDGVVLGAGIIEDKLLLDKDLQSWDRVFGTKVDSAFLLARYLRPETLRFLVFFTSVAGRYGNSGQTDYAVANELLNRMAWQLQQQWRHVKVSAINWGPWAGTRHGPGMVSDDTRRKFESRGVTLVPPSGGARAFYREVVEAPLDEVEIVVGEGPWEKHESDMGRLSNAAAEPAERTSKADLPLLFGAVHSVESSGATLHLRRRIATSTDRYLMQHLIDDVPVLPAAVALELLAEAASAFWPSWHVTDIVDLRAMRGIKLTDGTFDAEVIAHAPPPSQDEFAASLELRSAGGVGPAHYRARVQLSRSVPAPIAYHEAVKFQASGMTARDAYRERLFHGPCFQVITRMVGLDARGALAEVRPSDAREWLPGVRSSRGWLFDPGLVDSGPQMALLWAYANGAESALPSRFGRVSRFGTEPLGPCRMHFVIRPERPAHQVHADIAFVDQKGQVRILMEQVECTSSAALNRLGGGWKGEICV